MFLKSGGPRMTIISISGDVAVCVWAEKNRTFREQFEVVALRKYTPSGPMVFTL